MSGHAVGTTASATMYAEDGWPIALAVGGRVAHHVSGGGRDSETIRGCKTESAGAPFFASRQRVGDEIGGDQDPDGERSLATTETVMIPMANGISHAKSQSACVPVCVQTRTGRHAQAVVPHPSGVPEEWGTHTNDKPPKVSCTHHSSLLSLKAKPRCQGGKGSKSVGICTRNSR